MNSFKNISNQYITVILISYILSRIIVFFYFNISIDEKWFFGLWQHIKNDYLAKELFNSLLYFHAQPPLWNLILGFGLKIDDLLTLKIYMSFVNIFTTLIIIYCSYNILKLFNLKKFLILIFLLILIILSPSILFYENFPSYSHFTCMLVFLIKLYFLKIYKSYKLKYEILIYLFSSLLILTWSAYIIYFNFLIFLLLTPIAIKRKTIIKSVFIFVIFFLFAASPSIKNSFLFNIFANSSWTGLNSAQATGYDRVNWPLCSFNNDNIIMYNEIYKKLLDSKGYLDSKILNDKSYNDLGYIYKSKNCINGSKVHLIKNLIEITDQKLRRFFSVHAHLSIDFAFKPKNWKTSFVFLENLNQNNFFKLFIFMFFMTNYFLYFCITSASLLKSKKNYLDYFLVVNLVLYSYLMIISFYGSTWEQERMRYSEYSFIVISCVVIFNKFFQRNL